MKYRIHVKSIEEVTFELPEGSYGDEELTVEQIEKMEAENVKSDPTYFYMWEDATQKVEVKAEIIKDA